MCPSHQHCRDIIAKAVEKFGKVDVLAARSARRARRHRWAPEIL
jgi:hypothetical protein